MPFMPTNSEEYKVYSAQCAKYRPDMTHDEKMAHYREAARLEQAYLDIIPEWKKALVPLISMSIIAAGFAAVFAAVYGIYKLFQ